VKTIPEGLRAQDHCDNQRETTPGVRGQAEDLDDYLDLLEARARNKGKRTFTTEDVRREIGLDPGPKKKSL
jgi:hypothetical protein